MIEDRIKDEKQDNVITVEVDCVGVGFELDCA
jgi:hypothetical protein